MIYTLSILENDYKSLIEEIFSDPSIEGAAYLLCRSSKTEKELRLLVREVIPVEKSHYLLREMNRLSIDSQSLVNIAKKAILSNSSVIFVHSHPKDFDNFSATDNIEEEKIHSFLKSRIPDITNGSMIFSTPSLFKGRVKVGNSYRNISKVRIIGRKFTITDYSSKKEAIPEFFDRQVLAFGSDVQILLKRLHVGVVGAGGTGSAIVEQLTRLGVGELSIFDGDKLEKTNISRVFGSKTSDKNKNKAEIAKRNAQYIGLKTKVNAYPRDITIETIAKQLRNCDIVFGCTDNQRSRGILTQLSLYYLIPIIDLAVLINSINGKINEIIGRVTTFFPGEACLFCRGDIQPEMIRLETLSKKERKTLVNQRYAPELQTNDPSVIMFTNAVASHAITELFHRLTLFMGNERDSTETLLIFDQGIIRKNKENPLEGCLCQQTIFWAKGDSRNYLGMTW